MPVYLAQYVLDCPSSASGSCARPLVWPLALLRSLCARGCAVEMPARLYYDGHQAPVMIMIAATTVENEHPKVSLASWCLAGLSCSHLSAWSRPRHTERLAARALRAEMLPVLVATESHDRNALHASTHVGRPRTWSCSSIRESQWSPVFDELGSQRAQFRLRSRQPHVLQPSFKLADAANTV